MKKDFTKQKDHIKSLIDQHFIPILEEKLEAQISFVESVQELQRRFANIHFDPHERLDCVTRVKQYKEALIKLVEDYFTIKESTNFTLQFSAFEETVDNYIGSLDERIVRSQESERFIGLPEDDLFVKVGKKFKRVFFAISKFPERVSNLYRKICKKSQNPLKDWTHNIDYQNLTRFYMKELLSYRLVKLLHGIHQRKCTTSLLAWKTDEGIVATAEAFLSSDEPFDIDESITELTSQALGELAGVKETIRKEITVLFDQTQNEFESAFYKAGTFELSNRGFNHTAILKKHSNLQEETINIEKGWQVTWQVLRDDWQIDNELYHLLLSAYGASFTSIHTLQSKLGSNIIPSLDKLTDYLTQLKKRIEKATNIPDQKKIITKEKEAFFSIFITQLIPTVNDLVLFQDFPSMIDHVDVHTNKLISQISTKRSIIRNPDFTGPVRSSTVSYISPYELITFESWPQLFNVIKEVKIELVNRITNIQNSIIELGQIASFSLESALEVNTEDASGSSPGEIASEGLNRSLERLDEIKESLLNIDKLWEDDLFPGLQTFSASLIELTDNNNIIDLRVRIAKGKALKRGRLIYKQSIHKVRSLFPVVTRKLINLRNELRQLIKGTFKKYGISTKPDSITSEMADFLAETQQSIQKLPFVYQRLFKIEHLSDSNFFIGREKELQSLKHAYDNWVKGRFANVVLVGELGSGITSLLNMFIKEYSGKAPVLRIKADTRISTKTELFNFLNEQFKQNLSNIDDWVDYLNAQKKQLVIIEDIQRFYLKIVNGFEALKELSELLSRTSKTIFWILTCTEYAFRYLDKTILLSDQFSYLIRLELFDDNTMIDIIKRRNAVSGFNIRFEPAPSEISSKKYRKQTEEEKQVILQREYFSDLNKNVKSNISLALIYWLRSVSEVTGNTIVIRSMKDMNLSFLNSLSATKLFVLCAFILHERLTEDNLGLVMNIKTIEARRLIQPLCEDGILVSSGTYFSVNPLLYMKTISLLKNKNIIH